MVYENEYYAYFCIWVFDFAYNDERCFLQIMDC